MMHSFVGASLPGVPSYPAQYTHDAFLEDLSRQMAVSANRRYSRGSNGAHTGTAMRVAKPSSASNSPRNSLLQQRRRTMMNDPAFIQRAQQVVEQPYLPTPGPEPCNNIYYEPVKKAPRPVSWHPSTMAQTQQYMTPVSTQPTQYPFPSYCEVDCYAAAPAPAPAPAPVQFPPTPAAYSAYSSPASAFSPLNLPYSNYELPQTYSSPSWDVSATEAAATIPASTLGQAQYSFTPGPSCAPSLPGYVATSHSPANWASLAHEAPPTPEDPPKSQQPDPALQNDESSPFQSLDEHDDEEEGDILIGLGLYDPPEKLPFNSGLLGASFEYQPTGKGLKLEDAWEPPVSDDDDDEEDGEGEVETADGE